jgi:hypothetical protein
MAASDDGSRPGLPAPGQLPKTRRTLPHHNICDHCRYHQCFGNPSTWLSNIPTDTARRSSSTAWLALCIDNAASPPNQSGCLGHSATSQPLDSCAVSSAMALPGYPCGPGEVRDRSIYSTPSWSVSARRVVRLPSVSARLTAVWSVTS